MVGGDGIVLGGPNPFNLALKDPLVWRSDDWDFPTYKFPSVGWLGRVHRGTPWQTVYLKSPDIFFQQTQVQRCHNQLHRHQHLDEVAGEWQFVQHTTLDPRRDHCPLMFSPPLLTTMPARSLSVNVGAGDPSPQAPCSAVSSCCQQCRGSGPVPTNNFIALQHANLRFAIPHFPSIPPRREV